MKCDKCSENSVITLSYGPHYFCKNHFLEFFEKRVRKNIRVNELIKKGDKVIIGVSGGKDSLCALYLIQKIMGKLIELHALMIDEGIPNYREKAIQKGIELCEKLNVSYSIISLKNESGYSMKEIKEKIDLNPELGSTCSFCGVLRREILNSKSKKMNASKLATGHNLDDETQSIAMNLFEADINRLARLGAKTGEKEFKEFIPRIKPLYDSPEKEIIAFMNFQGIDYYKDECCPYSWMAKRNSYRKMLNELEDEFPGTKYSLLSSFKQLKPLLAKRNQKITAKCIKCGSITNQELCGSCRLIEKLNKAKGNSKKKPKKEKKLTCISTKKWNS
ncbi:MAG: TIGR00269 family protein [Candidatus Diapherotrites archaeon]|nr:TIGR00269 family protein [Candidatus Diapherotrites archaeon]